MKLKSIIKMIFALAIIMTALSLTSYATDEPPAESHEHIFGEWENTKQSHKRVCTVEDCEEFEEGEHIYGAWSYLPQEGYQYRECGACQYRQTHTHILGDYIPDPENSKRHYRICSCLDPMTKNFEDCTFDEGTEIAGGIKYTCSKCQREKIHEHIYGEYIPDESNEVKHYRVCIGCEAVLRVDCNWSEPSQISGGIQKTCNFCQREYIHIHQFETWNKIDGSDYYHFSDCGCDYQGSTQTGECEFGNPVVEAEGTVYTCSKCMATKFVPHPDHEHVLGDTWQPDEWRDDQHYKICFCGDETTMITGNCEWDDGVTVESSDDIKYTCLICGRERIHYVFHEHELGEWTADYLTEDKHYKECYCGDPSVKVQESCDFELINNDGLRSVYCCTVCGRSKMLIADHEHLYGEEMYYANDNHAKECSVCGRTEHSACSYTGYPVKGPSQYSRYDVLYLTCSECKNVKTVDIFATPSISDGQSGVSVKVPSGSSALVAKETVLKANKLTQKPSNEQVYKIKKATNEDVQVLVQYDLSLLSEGAQVQPGGKVSVTLPAIKDADKYDFVTVVFIDGSGNVKKCATTLNKDGSVTFEAEHFSVYAVVGSPVVFSAWAIIAIVASVLIVAGAVAFATFRIIVSKKKK